MRLSLFLLIASVFGPMIDSFATHLRAADIIVEQECNSLRYKITVRVYLNSISSTPFGGFQLTDGHLNFGDGSQPQVMLPSAIVGPEQRPDLGPNISIASYTTFHTFSSAGLYRVTYFERDRSRGILNIADSEDVAYSTFVIINARKDHCNKLPVLQVAPVDRGCRGVVFYHSAGATDIDGDSLSYEMTIPSRDSINFVSGFIQPDDEIFYSDFAHGNEAGTGLPSISIDPVTGLITWDAPGLQGEYNIAFKIIEWRFDPATENYFVISTVVRDMQIVVEDCFNGRPTLTGPADLCIEAGQTVSGTFEGKDPENHSVRFDIVSPIFEGQFPATFEPTVLEFVPSDPPAQLHIEWKTNCIHARDQVYQVVIKVTDQPPAGPKLVTFRTWNIKVIAPAPQWTATEPDLVDRTAKLNWQDYSCMNAEKIQLWRKVGSYPFSPGQCVDGLSVHKGYTLIDEFDPSVSSFTDTNGGRKLSVGAQYCYRLVAVFPLPAGGKSYVSQEACVGPILADAPVITNVSVHTTAGEEGKIEIRWMKPFDISPLQYPEPYQYEIYRSGGFVRRNDQLNISGRISDATSFIDETANTKDSIYNYQIVLYSTTNGNDGYNAIDTSSVASTVRLSLEPGDQRITLRWAADVPWSNVVSLRPRHRIFRGVAGQPENEFLLIDSVDVSEHGFEYIDTGKFQSDPIRENVYYCYYIETIGSYGNPQIPLLLNRSQIACSYPVNNLPPCIPVLDVSRTDCEKFFAETACAETLFQNHISWSLSNQGGCRSDITAYKLYYSDSRDGDYTLLRSFTSENAFEDEISMPARCYRILAVDAAGVESQLSEPQCVDICPYFDLPNVFTPNDDGCNDVFTAYASSDDPGICAPSDPVKCPRFVKSIFFKVLNRWGRVVYEYHSDAGNPVSINWDGRDKNGALLGSGTYFYTADVQFFSVDKSPSRRMKGWISLLR